MTGNKIDKINKGTYIEKINLIYYLRWIVNKKIERRIHF